MRLATLRTSEGTSAALVDAGSATLIEGFADVGRLLQDPDWRALAQAASGDRLDLLELAPEQWAAVVPAPSKIVCVGLNYRNHILEMGRELPEHPTLFAKYPEALVGPYDPIVVPGYAAGALDWEGELAVVIGAPARRLEPEQAESVIAGYSVINDVTMRDFQYRTPEWFQGKTFEKSSPFGPVLVTSDEYELGTTLVTTVDGEVVQKTSTDDLVFGPAQLVSYISKIVTLNPGDVIASGTPGGVGHARKPPRYLTAGSELGTSIGGIGELRNTVVVE
ncbi:MULTISPECIES: fumarylacetoacetate hydrolase family protein [unclassified Rathayibacter]|uniref:fumarylacetoacetate hydrolase family protein n=1 Tax=unclassified Rathayibacter TaxID=2609250 RepID=UPI001FB283B4|nr:MULTISPECIES: fumarylacetoacetate hydrolase family protein [unclassified Rathayibacter]MCJ1675477.1 fumarylacetoacetate hydrolase family protein [Rathayibacter sp. VKM Ac-2929]MCJ1688410.1 fumarylacetoacetate hydrolase family protein [Rathayibacter sp. VKM Ac-2927]